MTDTVHWLFWQPVANCSILNHGLDEFQRHAVAFADAQIAVSVLFAQSQGRRQRSDPFRMVPVIGGIGIDFRSVQQFEAGFFRQGDNSVFADIAGSARGSCFLPDASRCSTTPSRPPGFRARNMAQNTDPAWPAFIQLCTLRKVSTLSAEQGGAMARRSGGCSTVSISLP